MKKFDDIRHLMVKYNKYGYADRKGHEIIDCMYSSASEFKEKRAAVALTENGEFKWGYIDIFGNVVIDFDFDSARPFSEGFGAVKVGNKWGYINKKGEGIIECKYDKASDFNAGIAKVELDGNNLYIDEFGKTIAVFDEKFLEKLSLGKIKLCNIPCEYLLNKEFYLDLKNILVKHVKHAFTKSNEPVNEEILSARINMIDQKLYEMWQKAVEERDANKEQNSNL